MGPLTGVRIIEMAGIGPGPFAGMLLADMGAEVIRIDRLGASSLNGNVAGDITNRGRKSIEVDLKNPEGLEIVLKLIESADALYEGFRPGVMEKLGLGPDVCLARNPNIVYGRITGWGQDGPLAMTAGHDINYISLSGALDSIGRKGQEPIVPLNLVGDFGGGAMYLVMGLLAAIINVKNGGKGQVIDAAISDGTASLMSLMQAYIAQGMWTSGRGQNLLDGGAPFYDCYETADKHWISFGALEPKFYQQLIDKTGASNLGSADYGERFDQSKWPELRANLKALFLSEKREHWDELLGLSDACYAPVLTIEDAPNHPHNKARNTFFERDGVVQASPAPRFSDTQSEAGAPEPAGGHSHEILQSLDFSAEQIEQLKSSKAIA